MTALSALRPYQQRALEQIASAPQLAVACMPTGAGKTTLAAALIEQALQQGRRALFLAHRIELIDQCRRRLQAFGMRPGIIAAQHRTFIAPATVASIPTLNRRKAPPAELIIVDECHHSNSGTFRKLIDFYAVKGAKVIGLTATPYRLDGKGLGDIFQEIITPVTVEELIAENYLVKPVYYTAPFSRAGLHVQRGDFSSAELRDKFDKREKYGQVVEKYKTHAQGTKALVFNVSIEHSRHICDEFNYHGISAVHVDADTPSHVRQRIVSDFSEGKFPVLCNVNLFTEGFDLPALDTVIINRATASKALYTQMVGRALRYVPGKEKAIIIDHGSNVETHDFIEAQIDFALTTTRQKPKQAPPMKECPVCYNLVYASVMKCQCGYCWPPAVHEVKEVEFVELTFQKTELLTMSELYEYNKKSGKKLKEIVSFIWKQTAGIPDRGTLFYALLTQYAGAAGYKRGWVDRWCEIYHIKTKQKQAA